MAELQLDNLGPEVKSLYSLMAVVHVGTGKPSFQPLATNGELFRERRVQMFREIRFFFEKDGIK